MRRIVFILAALMFAFSIAACGQKGPLKLPQDVPAPKAISTGTGK